MSRKTWMYLALSGTLLYSAGVARAQEAVPDAPPPPPMMMLQAGVPGEGGPAGPFAEGVELLGFGGLHGGKVVKGVPFSAVAVSETTQTLADGTHISRKTQSNFYRDGQGRTRREVTVQGFGPLAASGQPRSFVTIHDPVAGTNYILEPDQKIARKFSPPRAGARDAMKGMMKDHARSALASGDFKKEDLGTKTINGVSAQGTRFTRTIPAGQIGNDQPITIVSEHWYAQDLQMVVMSKRSDPRFGTTTYTVTNIQRQEPDAALFTVPADYTVKDAKFGKRGGPGMFRRHGPPPPPPPPPAPSN